MSGHRISEYTWELRFIAISTCMSRKYRETYTCNVTSRLKAIEKDILFVFEDEEDVTEERERERERDDLNTT